MAFVGTGRVDAANLSHQGGLSQALDAALDDLAAQNFAPPVRFETCEIRYFAKVSVTNPAVIDEYVVILTALDDVRQ